MPRMTISAHTRKVLWSLSANSCARCSASLVHTPDAAGDPHAVVGQECHIVARAPGGPRGLENVDEIDGHSNLILLCANCHAIVDAQPTAFPPEELRRIKRMHEEQVAKRNKIPIPNVSLRGRGQPLSLALMQSGDRLLSLLGPALSWTYGTPDCLSPSQREVVGDFLQCRRRRHRVNFGPALTSRYVKTRAKLTERSARDITSKLVSDFKMGSAP